MEDKVRRASSGKNVLRDDFCPDPKPGQVILMNCQKAKLTRAKLGRAKDSNLTPAGEGVWGVPGAPVCVCVCVHVSHRCRQGCGKGGRHLLCLFAGLLSVLTKK